LRRSAALLGNRVSGKLFARRCCGAKTADLPKALDPRYAIAGWRLVATPSHLAAAAQRGAALWGQPHAAGPPTITETEPPVWNRRARALHGRGSVARRRSCVGDKIRSPSWSPAAPAASCQLPLLAPNQGKPLRRAGSRRRFRRFAGNRGGIRLCGPAVPLPAEGRPYGRPGSVGGENLSRAASRPDRSPKLS
jgi:hypothetical protein